jgi:hypothetical protein
LLFFSCANPLIDKKETKTINTIFFILFIYKLFI